MEQNATPSWGELALSPAMLELIEKLGYKSPTPVQSQSIPAAILGQDILVSSQTGSGKTASFVIPAVERFKGKNGTYILALAPTREIAQQTGEVFKTFGEPFGLKTVVCIGGASIPEEKAALSSSPHIIVATPGRLCDHLERGNVWLDFIQCLIFDEADRMLEMGFAKQIDLITEQIPKERQTMMLSATFAPQVEKLAKKALNNPKQILIEKTVESAPKIEEELYWISEGEKLGRTLRVLERDPGTAFIFVNQKEKAYQVWRLLTSKGFESATYIHSDLPQETREQAVADFKSGKYRVIVATDVMGRGIDVDDVSHVINYDVPREAADYVHRIGRTGRRGLTGRATTFAIPRVDEMSIRAIEKLKGIESPEIPPKGEGKSEGRSESRGAGRGDNRGRRDRGPRQERGPRPEGERSARPDRGPRLEGERRPRPEGERGPRPERRPRPEGERGPRPERGPRRDQRPQAPREAQNTQATPAPSASAPKAGVIQKITKFFSKLLVK